MHILQPLPDKLLAERHGGVVGDPPGSRAWLYLDPDDDWRRVLVVVADAD